MARRKVIAIGRPVRDGDIDGILRRTGFQPSQIPNPGRMPKKPRPSAGTIDKRPAGNIMDPNTYRGIGKRKRGGRARYS